MGGIKEGDFVVEINSLDAKWMTQKQAIDLIKKSGNSLDLKVITPMTSKNYIKVRFQNKPHSNDHVFN